jgi:hypothetical protein
VSRGSSTAFRHAGDASADAVIDEPVPEELPPVVARWLEDPEMLGIQPAAELTGLIRIAQAQPA